MTTERARLEEARPGRAACKKWVGMPVNALIIRALLYLDEPAWHASVFSLAQAS